MFRGVRDQLKNPRARRRLCKGLSVLAVTSAPWVWYYTSDSKQILLLQWNTMLKSSYMFEGTGLSQRAAAARESFSGQVSSVTPDRAVLELREIMNVEGLSSPDWAHEELASLGGVGVWRVTNAVASPQDKDDEVAIMYAHGGRFVAGSAMRYMYLLSTWTYPLNASIGVIDYPLAPEVSPEHIVEAFTQACRSILDEQGGERLILAGDGTGAAIIFSALMKLKDEGRDLPAAVVLTSPSADLLAEGSFEQDRLTSNQTWRAVRSLTGSEESLRRVSPLRQEGLEKFSGMPETLILYGTRDLSVDQAKQLKDRLLNADVRVETIERKYLWPNWLFCYYTFPEGWADMQIVRDFIDGATSRTPQDVSLPQHPFLKWIRGVWTRNDPQAETS
ncbi:hypothetical protein NDN08_002477 [Rhodosorus marinus]|uniref:Alpha/beta hydrolase fold-3 domain-containing protein n=1 Tax=Rhodosorus marinus TaxID=101924 RepID=A0AAV8UTU4_9RHOD|nr:hypothetical protein NDN08_002477 [Rhodosorus marinus]